MTHSAPPEPAGAADFDVVIIGGGFFGCALSLLFRSMTDRILVIERDAELMTRASAVNQARVHSGLHYPRNFVTAQRSLKNFPIFTDAFRSCIQDDFEMLYAIARRKSHVQANRFEAMYKLMGAPIRRASPSQSALFDTTEIEAVFTCQEYAFDWTRLRQHLRARMTKHDVPVWFETEAHRVRKTKSGHLEVDLSNGATVGAKTVFNVGYAQLNTLLRNSGLDLYPLKHEMVEIALVTPPAELNHLAVTVMDGPFFSVMPFPAEGAYSLSHVRYTPQASWIDTPAGPSAYEQFEQLQHHSRWRHMVNDAARYMPCLAGIEWQQSLFDVKTVLLRNEFDDGRPILMDEHEQMPGLFSILGGKIDNIFDLFEFLQARRPDWAALSPHLVTET
ncbi:FAD-dependent oxidoreductase [Ruegeria sp. HKCCA4812]|uniref:FAD-dependent oxidoreductase n=1 Tax=Ruegeria sp. HKCCA4812 TaxID=2682993 RepID=UPI001487CD73|nr:FAD-dependent oxidoreductase [Ruegeria sp. HKCCA4812]